MRKIKEGLCTEDDGSHRSERALACECSQQTHRQLCQSKDTRQGVDRNGKPRWAYRFASERRGDYMCSRDVVVMFELKDVRIVLIAPGEDPVRPDLESLGS
jgi:hypothetical protein